MGNMHVPVLAVVVVVVAMQWLLCVNIIVSDVMGSWHIIELNGELLCSPHLHVCSDSVRTSR